MRAFCCWTQNYVKNRSTGCFKCRVRVNAYCICQAVPRMNVHRHWQFVIWHKITLSIDGRALFEGRARVKVYCIYQVVCCGSSLQQPQHTSRCMLRLITKEFAKSGDDPDVASGPGPWSTKSGDDLVSGSGVRTSLFVWPGVFLVLTLCFARCRSASLRPSRKNSAVKICSERLCSHPSC